MNIAHVSKKTLITGASGTGKTTLFLRRWAESSAQYKFHFDHEGEFAIRTKTQPAQILSDMNAATARGTCVFDPSATFPGRTREAFDFFCDYVFSVSARLRGQKVFCCDELQKLTGPRTDEISPELSCVLETGRRFELDFIGITQSPNLINTRIRNQLTEIVCFKLMDERAVKFVSDCGFPETEVRALKPGHWICRDLNSGKVTKGKVFG